MFNHLTTNVSLMMRPPRLRLPSEEAVAWRDEAGSCPPTAPSPAPMSAPHAWLNRVTQEEEERKRRGMEEEEEGRKGAASIEAKEDESRGKKDMQEKLNKLFSQPADPWASTGELRLEECRFRKGQK